MSDAIESRGVEGLYPFLYSGRSNVNAVLDQAAASTAAKSHEIIELRQKLAYEMADDLIACAEKMAERFASGGRLLLFGNGGSSTDATHVASCFMAPAKGRPALPALSLTADVAVVTALANDVGFDVVFARQVAAFGSPRDIAFGISTSGNSPNVVSALEEAARRGLLTVGLSGYDGGRMRESDVIEHLFVVHSPSVHRIQEAQTTIYDALWELTHRALEARRGGDQ